MFEINSNMLIYFVMVFFIWWCVNRHRIKSALRIWSIYFVWFSGFLWDVTNRWVGEYVKRNVFILICTWLKSVSSFWKNILFMFWCQMFRTFKKLRQQKGFALDQIYMIRASNLQQINLTFESLKYSLISEARIMFEYQFEKWCTILHQRKCGK